MGQRPPNFIFLQAFLSTLWLIAVFCVVARGESDATHSVLSEMRRRTALLAVSDEEDAAHLHEDVQGLRRALVFLVQSHSDDTQAIAALTRVLSEKSDLLSRKEREEGTRSFNDARAQHRLKKQEDVEVETKTVREKIQAIRQETEALVKHLLASEKAETRTRLLRQLEDRRYALRTYETYLNDLEESQGGANVTVLRGEIKTLESGAEFWKRELKDKLASVPKEIFLGLTFYIIDQKTMASEKAQVLNRLTKAAAAASE